MPWLKQHFIAILDSDIALQLFSDPEIFAYAGSWTDEHKAALLHANHITPSSTFRDAAPLLQLVAAFARKDLARIDYLLNHKYVSAGARMDYLLPLYDEAFGGGEDVFVASTKALLNEDVSSDVHLPAARMVHKVDEKADSDYSDDELREIENYVNNANLIRNLLKNAPNKTVIQPEPLAVDYYMRNAAQYRDTNNNPVIVFIPGAISIDGWRSADLIQKAVDHGANVNDIGFFGVPGIVWSIILGDVDGVKKFLQLKARLDIEDEMRNPHVRQWLMSTLIAAADDPAYCQRLADVNCALAIKKPALFRQKAVFFAPSDLTGNVSPVNEKKEFVKCCA